MKLTPEDSAQGSGAKPNPIVPLAIRNVVEVLGQDALEARVADQGAGRLRHLPHLAAAFGSVLLVDTPLQAGRRQRLLGRSAVNYADVAREISAGGRQVAVATSDQFAASDLGLDFVLSACVFDAIPPEQREEVARAAARNTRPGGWFSVIVPRNDQSILRRFSDSNAYADGHVFTRNASTTFFKNFRDEEPLSRLIRQHGFVLEANRSRYRHVWLTFRRR